MPDDRHIQIGKDAAGNTFITGDGNVVVVQTTRRIEMAPAPQASSLGPNPYQGLAAFTELEADRFFGRERLTQQLWERFRTLHEASPGQPLPVRLLPILGPSGCGKSSLARAGLLPALARRPLAGLRTPRVAVLTPGTQPLEELARVLARIATGDTTPVTKTREFAEELLKPGLAGAYDGLRRIADALPDIAHSPLIVLIDQWEELYTLCEDTAAQDIFVANVLHAASDRAARVSVILTLRSDFLGQTQRHAALNQAIAAAGSLIPAMSAAELREAIREPAARAGHALEQATVELLVQDSAGREGALPMLQFALTRIWEGLAAGVPAAQTLEAIGGVGGALAGEAQRLYASLSPADQMIARRAFLGLVRLGEGTRDTRRRVGIADLVAHAEDPEHVREVLRRFAQPGARLLTLAADHGDSDTAEITHEALFEHWEALQAWLDTSRDDLRFQRRLDEAAHHWHEQGRHEGSLWSPPDLDLLRAFQQRASGDMTGLQMTFFQASVRKESWARRRTRMALAALVALTIMASGAAVLAWPARDRAQRAEQTATTERQKAERRFDDVRGLANAFMFEFHDAIANLAGATPARKLVVEKAREYLDRLFQEVSDNPQLQRDRSVSYDNVGNIQAATGDTAGALASYRQSLAIAEGLANADPTNA